MERSWDCVDWLKGECSRWNCRHKHDPKYARPPPVEEGGVACCRMTAPVIVVETEWGALVHTANAESMPPEATVLEAIATMSVPLQAHITASGAVRVKVEVTAAGEAQTPPAG